MVDLIFEDLPNTLAYKRSLDIAFYCCLFLLSLSTVCLPLEVGSFICELWLCVFVCISVTAAGYFRLGLRSPQQAVALSADLAHGGGEESQVDGGGRRRRHHCRLRVVANVVCRFAAIVVYRPFQPRRPALRSVPAFLRDEN